MHAWVTTSKQCTVATPLPWVALHVPKSTIFVSSRPFLLAIEKKELHVCLSVLFIMPFSYAVLFKHKSEQVVLLATEFLKFRIAVVR